MLILNLLLVPNFVYKSQESQENSFFVLHK